MTSVIKLTPDIDLIFFNKGSLTGNDFPFAATIFISGSNELFREWMRSPNPLNIERTMMIAALMIPTATTEIMDITLIKFFFLLDKRYRRAIKSGRFKTMFIVRPLVREEYLNF